MPRLALLLAFSLLPSACGRLPPAAAPAGGGEVRLWQDARIFEPVGGLLAAAAGLALVEMYEFDRPDLDAALLAARARGADVRVIVDPSVAESVRTATRLRSAALPVRLYPLDERRHQIDHVKLLLTEQAAVVGGMNWGRHSAANHDYALEIRAPPLLSRLRAIFEQDWSLAGGVPAPLPVAAGAVLQTSPGEEVRAGLAAALAGPYTHLTLPPNPRVESSRVSVPIETQT